MPYNITLTDGEAELILIALQNNYYELLLAERASNIPAEQRMFGQSAETFANLIKDLDRRLDKASLSEA